MADTIVYNEQGVVMVPMNGYNPKVCSEFPVGTVLNIANGDWTTI